ncbi:MAG TPA: hypothetical protein VFY06_12390, partial [Verrucomicrobiae bacterium]|nr:hypothetical protein [Verrucomicrobiae bacterium]
MKSKLLSAFAVPAALALCLSALPVRAQDNNVTISAPDFQSLVYSAHLETQLGLKPGLGACLQTLLEMQRRNPNADPLALANVSREALQFYRTNEPVYIRTNGYPDEILAAYLDALRQIPAHTNFVPASLTLLNYFMLDAADYNYFTNDTVLGLINSADQRLSSSEGQAIKRQALVDNCVSRAHGNAAFAAAMNSLLLPETGVSLQETPAEIIGDTNSPLHDDDTMTTLLALSQASGNGSLTVSSNQLMTLFTNEMQTIQGTINTNLAVLAQINQSQPDLLAYLTNQAAIDANTQLQTEVQRGQPARLASATAAGLVQSKLMPENKKSAQIEGTVSAIADIGIGIATCCVGEEAHPEGLSSVVSGGLEVFNLFTGNQSPQDLMAAQISNIETLMGDLSHNVNYRFDRVDQSLTTIYNTMNQQFSQIEIQNQGTAQEIAQLKGNVYEIRNSLVTVQSSLDRIEAENFASFNTLQYNQLVGPIDNDLLYRVQYPSTRGPFPETGSSDSYTADEGLFYGYANNEANDAVSSPSSSLDLSASSLQQQLAARPLDANLNYIQQYLISTLGVNTVGTPGSPFYLSNPQEWFIAAYAYLQLAGENPMYFRKDASRGRVSDIISRGQNVANFCGRLTLIPGTTNINWSLWNALESDYVTNLVDFNGQVSTTEAAYANDSGFNVGIWRQWDAAAQRVTATDTAVLGAPQDTNTPAGLTNVVAIAEGGDADFGDFTLALKADGTVVGWGQNQTDQTNIPAGLSNVVAIAAGGYHSLALKADGTVVGWGENDLGEATGVPDNVYPYISSGPVTIAGQPLTNVVAIAAAGYHSLALKADGTVVGWGDDNYGETTNIPPGVTNVVAIATGYAHSLALKADGTVIGWGDNYYHEATSPAGLTNAVAIAAGDSFSLAVKADGTVFGWGGNGVGQATGVPNNVSPFISSGPVTIAGQPLTNVVAIAAGESYGLALKADSTVVGWGQDGHGQSITIPTGLTNVMAITAGIYSSFFLTATNTGGSAASGSLTFIRAKLPERLGTLFQGCNSNTLDKLAHSGSDLNNAAGQLSAVKLLLTDVLELGMPYTLARDGVLHGFLYGSESLMDNGAATGFLQSQNAQLQSSPTLAPRAPTAEGALRYVRFQDRLNQDLTQLQATGQPEIPRLVGQTLRRLNLLNDAYTAPTNSPPPVLEISSQTNTPSLLLY